MRDVDDARRRQARRQALALGIALAVLGALVAAWQQRPDDRDELKIPISALRSQAAESALLLAQAGDPLPPRFVRAQATQLARAVGSSREELLGLKLEPALEPRRRQAEPIAGELDASVQRLQGAVTSPAASASAAQRMRDALQALEDALGDR
jgi:hypothetical protein